MSLGILATTYKVIDLSDEICRNDVEVAVVASDECQNQGLGMELFRRVVQIARDGKLSRVDAEILPDNFAVHRAALLPLSVFLSGTRRGHSIWLPPCRNP